MTDWGTVAISSRFFEGVHPAFTNCLLNMAVNGGLRPGDRWLTAPIRKAAHHGANAIVKAFLATDCDTLLTLDNDHAFAPDTLERLRSDPAGWEYDVLLAMYASRGSRRALLPRLVPGTDEDYPEFEMLAVPPEGGIVPVDQVGLGFTLTRRAVFEKTLAPWFYYLWVEFTNDVETTEDIAWCRDARRAGFKIGVHTGVRIAHLTTGLLVVGDEG